MRPTSTHYRISTELDEPNLHVMAQGLVPRRFPTVVAERDGQIIGFLGTHDRRDAILAGPLEVELPSGRHRAVVAMRLIQAYENVLTLAGIDHYFYVAEPGQWADAAGRCARSEFCGEAENGLCLFKRLLTAARTVH